MAIVLHNGTPAKCCSKCGVVKPVEQFTPFVRSKDGYKSQCKECCRLAQAEYRRANRALYNERENERRRKYPERYRASYQKHAEEHRQRRREYYQVNKAIELAKYHLRREMNIEKYRESTNKWRRNNPIRVRYHHALRRARKRNATIGQVDYRTIWERDQGICHLCKQHVSPDDLHFDHVTPLAKGGAHSMDNIKVSHRLCNQRKKDKLI